MLNINSESKIYVFCPKDSVTGGAELLHQLVHIINVNKKNAFLVYFDPKNDDKISSGEIPSDYSKYDIKLANSIPDNINNVVVIYEGIFHKLRLFKEAQIFLWWLSVDNFYYCSGKYLSVFDYYKWDKKIFGKILISRFYNLFFRKKNYFKNNLTINNISKLDVLNGYQSEYAQNFLQNNYFKEMLPLKDYINDQFFEKTKDDPKINSILYNPKKGIEFTKKIMNRFPNHDWIPLENMSRGEMITKLKESKLYIDFGFHPGKDRIPREAVMSGCCLITGIDGSAGFFEDVAILNQYKIEKKHKNIEAVGKLIDDILNNYEKHNQNFEFYRQRIKNEKEEFVQDTIDIFCNY